MHTGLSDWSSTIVTPYCHERGPNLSPSQSPLCQTRNSGKVKVHYLNVSVYLICNIFFPYFGDHPRHKVLLFSYNVLSSYVSLFFSLN